MNLSPLAVQKFFDNNGRPLVGGLLFTYAAGTTTKIATYVDEGGAANTNPIVLDYRGECRVWLDPELMYKFVLSPPDDTDPPGNPIWTVDDISAGVSEQEITQQFIGQLLWPRTALEISQGITPINYAIQPQNAFAIRYGAVGNSNGTPGNGTNDTQAIDDLASCNPGWMVDGGGLSYRVSKVLPNPSVPPGFNLFNGQVVSDQMVTAQDEYSVTIFGWNALLNNTYIPEQHPASGGRNFASGNHIVAIGREAMKANTSGRRNTAVGSRAMISNTSGNYNTALGSHTMENCTIGIENTAVGVQALQSVVNGGGNTAVGIGAGNKITSGSNNVSIGYSAGAGASASASTGNGNVSIGYRAQYFLTLGQDNVAVGRDALVSNEQGNECVAIGADAALNNVNGIRQTAVGTSALRLATSNDHVAVGAYALDAITTGLGGTAVGYNALTAATGDYNTAVGITCLRSVTSGSNNTGVGRDAGVTLTTGGNNTLFGYGTDVSAAGATNQNAFGYNATCTGDNQVTLGNAGIATLRCQVTTITALSDARDKKDIEDVTCGLDVISAVRPVRWVWDARDGSKSGVTDYGFIAQELLAAQSGNEWLGLVDTSNPDKLEATPGKLLPIMVKAIQELTERIKKLEEQ